MALFSALAAAAMAAGSFIGARGQQSADSRIMDRANTFAERMSSTAYQRGMADMKKAGLNPILAYKQGGATAPTSASFKAQNPLGAAAQSALATYSATSAVRNQNQDTKLKAAQTNKASADAKSADLDYRKKSKGGDHFVISTAVDANRAFKSLQKYLGQYQNRTLKAPASKTRVQKIAPPTKKHWMTRAADWLETNYPTNAQPR